MTTLILLHSKFSQNSINLIELIKQSQISKYIQINDVCIDNKLVRKKIQKNNNFDIKYVPCILSIGDDGSVEKYESEDAFNFISEIIKEITPNQQEEAVKEEEVVQTPDVKQSKSSGKTAIDDLEELEELEELEDGSNTLLKKAGILNNNGNVDFDDDVFGNNHGAEVDQIVTKAIKTNTDEGDSIMARAQNMQKNRDIEFGEDKRDPFARGI
jgi:hypothetical protein